MSGVLLILGFLATSAEAGEYRLLEIDRVDFEAQKLRPENRDPYSPQFTENWRERAAIKWDITILEYGYWRNNVHTETAGSGSTVKTVGWEWEAGVRLGKYADVFHYHHSRHIMEGEPEARFNEGKGNQFPVEDALGVRFHLYRKDK